MSDKKLSEMLEGVVKKESIIKRPTVIKGEKLADKKILGAIPIGKING